MRLVIIIILSWVCSDICSQNLLYIDEIEQNLNSHIGLEKLQALNLLSEYYLTRHPRKGISYGKRANDLSKNLFDSKISLKDIEHESYIDFYFLLAKAYYEKNGLIMARNEFWELTYIFENDTLYHRHTEVEAYLKEINLRIEKGDSKDNIFKKTASKVKTGMAVRESKKGLEIKSILYRAKMLQKKGNHADAALSLQKAIKLLHEKGDEQRAQELEL